MADTRYSDSDLKEFEELIHSKLEQARSDFDQLQRTKSYEDYNRTDDTAQTIKMMEDGSDAEPRPPSSQRARRSS